MDDDVEQFLNNDILDFIRRKAKQLAGKYGFHRDEIEDIQQCLIVDCLQRVRRFDARRAPRDRFARHVVKHGVARLIESRRAIRRGHGARLCSLSGRADEDSPNLADLISDDGGIRKGGSASARFEHHLLMRLDVAQTLVALPADLRRICRLLMVLDHAAQVAAAIGISRATLYRRMRIIRAHFVSARFGAASTASGRAS